MAGFRRRRRRMSRRRDWKEASPAVEHAHAAALGWRRAAGPGWKPKKPTYSGPAEARRRLKRDESRGYKRSNGRRNERRRDWKEAGRGKFDLAPRHRQAAALGWHRVAKPGWNPKHRGESPGVYQGTLKSTAKREKSERDRRRRLRRRRRDEVRGYGKKSTRQGDHRLVIVRKSSRRDERRRMTGRESERDRRRRLRRRRRRDEVRGYGKKSSRRESDHERRRMSGRESERDRRRRSRGRRRGRRDERRNHTSGNRRRASRRDAWAI